MQSPPFPRYLVPPRSKYSPQHHVLKHSSRNVSDQVSHPYKTTGKIIVLYILIFQFLDSSLEDKIFCNEWQQAFPDLNLLLISSAIVFWFVKVVPKYLNSSTLSKVLLSILTLRYVRIMKQTASWRGKNGEYIPCLKYPVPTLVG